MANETKNRKASEEKSSEALDLILANFTEPDVTESVAEAQQAPRIIGKLMTLLILVPLMIIVGVLIVKDKGLIDKTSSFINKVFASKKKQDQIIRATFSWEKEPSQYGLDPEIRRSVPMEAVITRNDDDVFNFVFYYYHKGIKEKGVFEGERTATGRIEGTWSQVRPKDGGEWYLEQNSQRLFTGKHRDRSGDWIPMKLQIKLN